MNHSREVVRILRGKRDELKPVLPFDLTETTPVVFDLSAHSRGSDRKDWRIAGEWRLAAAPALPGYNRHGAVER